MRSRAKPDWHSWQAKADEFAGYSFLIVDDQLERQDLISEYLISLGADPIQIAGDAFEAFEKTREWSPDLALVDVQLPAMTGFELVQKWREHDRSIKVLILSGVAKKAADGLRAGKIRVAEYLVAPFHLRELAFLAKRALLFGKPICPVVGVYSQKKSVGVLRNAVSELMNDKQVEAENDIKTLSFKNRN
jgi:CheY-like chemotaxis protein